MNQVPGDRWHCPLVVPLGGLQPPPAWGGGKVCLEQDGGPWEVELCRCVSTCLRHVW